MGVGECTRVSFYFKIAPKNTLKYPQATGLISRDIGSIFKFNLSHVFLSKISSKNSAYQQSTSKFSKL
jgi:hypothetical protein